MTDDIGRMGAGELAALYRAGKLSPVEAVRVFLERIERLDPGRNAFAYVTPEIALAAARDSEARWHRAEPLGPIDGLPVTVKELTSVVGIPHRNGSALGAKEPATSEPLVMKRLRAQGVAILGTTTSPDFGWKGVTHGPATGATVNPWRRDRAAGGSSGGAAVAAALNLGVLHDGSDGGGSIRIPASFCGVFGFKPSYGWVPPAVLTPHFDLAHRGPLTRRVDDGILYFNAIAGPSTDTVFGYCPPEVPDWGPELRKGVRGLRVGYSRNLGYAEVAPDVAAALDRAAGRLAELGATVEEVGELFPNPNQAFMVLWHSAACNIVAGLKATADEEALLDPGLRAIAANGARYSANDYIEARLTSGRIRTAMALFHQRYDALMLPTMPITAFEAGHDVPPRSRMTDWTEWSPFTYPFNMTSQPTVSVPCGFDRDGLPVGLQFVASHYRDDLVLRLAAAYQEAFPEPFPDGE